MKTVKIPCGKGSIGVMLDEDRLSGVLQNKNFNGADMTALLDKSLTGPVVDRLREEISGKKVLIAVPDNTRRASVDRILPYLLKKIAGAAGSIEIIISTGMHKRHNAVELESIVGPGVFKEYRVMSHDQEKKSLARLGRTGSGVPIILNRRAAECDFIISIGLVEPHLYAGYSGGAKTVAIGLAGEETINSTHGIRFLDDSSTVLGSVSGNIFQQALWDIAAKVPLKFSINLIKNPDGEAVWVSCGPPRRLFREAVQFSRKVFEVKVKREADIAICGIGYPKDVNLYQASRAINYILNTDAPVIRRGGVVIVVAELRDGAGEGVAERRFYEELAEMPSAGAFLKKVKRTGCIAGVHRAYMVAGALLNYNVIFVSKNEKGIMNSLPIPCFDDIYKAIGLADRITGPGSKIYAVPRSLTTIASLGHQNLS